MRGKIAFLLCLSLSLYAPGWANAPQDTQTQQPAAQTSGDDELDKPVPKYDPENPNALETNESQADNLDRIPGQGRGDLYMNMIGGLLVVLGLIVLLAYLARRYLPNQFRPGQYQDRMRVLHNMPMGNRRYVSMIEVDGKRYLLGVTDHQINLIKAIDEQPFEQAFKDLEDVKTVGQMLEEEP